MSTNAETIGTQMPKIIPEVWSASLNKKLDKSGVGMKIVNKIYEKDIKNYGDTVHIGELGDVNVIDYEEGDLSTGMTLQKVSSTDQVLKLDQQKAFNFFLSDVTQAQAKIKDLQKKFEKRAKIAVDTVKDTFILGAFADIPAANKLADVTLTKDNAYDTFVELAKILKNNNAIQSDLDEISKDNQADGSLPWVVINPDVEAILLKSPEFIHATEKGDKVLRKGSIGSIAGLDVLVSTNLPTTSYKVNVMAGINDAIAFAGNISKVEVIRNDMFFGDNVRGLYVYGKKVVLPNALAGVVMTVGSAPSGD